MTKPRTYAQIATDLGFIPDSIEGLIAELERVGEMPWTVKSADMVLERLMSYETLIAEARSHVALAKLWASVHGTKDRKTSWRLTADMTYHEPGKHRDECVEGIVEAVRGYGFPGEPSVVKDGEKKHTLLLPFEVEANERETWEYVEEIRGAIVSYVAHDYTIEEVAE